MWFSSELVKSTFRRLRQFLVEGKSGVERTSALMYFLAYDSICHDHDPISLDPATASGKTNRNALTKEYYRLVSVRVIGNKKIWSVYDLGRVTCNGTDPSKRISSNFLTVPLKKASQRSLLVKYPNRPCPLLVLGPQPGIGNWGIGPYIDWSKNLPIFLSERISRSPFTDLAVFVLRDADFTPCANLPDTLELLLSDRFSKYLESFWSKQISRELKYNAFEGPEVWHSSDYHRAFEDEEWISSIITTSETMSLSNRVKHLENRISYLESLLKKHDIPFDNQGDTE